MARVTVEDCIDKVNNRFELVLLAAQRARALSRGEECRVERDRDKNTVVSLREIAGEQISPQSLRDVFLRSFTPAVPEMEKDDEQTDLIPTEQNIFGLQDISAEEEAAHLYGEERGTAPDEHSSSED